MATLCVFVESVASDEDDDNSSESSSLVKVQGYLGKIDMRCCGCIDLSRSRGRKDLEEGREHRREDEHKYDSQDHGFHIVQHKHRDTG